MGFKRIPQMRMPSGREAVRMMQRMGIEAKELEGVEQVIIKTASKQIVIDGPSVTAVTVQGQTVFQVAGGNAREELIGEEEALPREDIELVAQQANVSLDEAKEALKRTGGDLAQAILLLKERKT
jgi:nascent polypeptide-associated complex subunit alpha